MHKKIFPSVFIDPVRNKFRCKRNPADMIELHGSFANAIPIKQNIELQLLQVTAQFARSWI